MQSARAFDEAPTEEESQATEPLRRWHLIYLAVVVHLILWIVMLALFSRFFGSGA